MKTVNNCFKIFLGQVSWCKTHFHFFTVLLKHDLLAEKAWFVVLCIYKYQVTSLKSTNSIHLQKLHNILYAKFSYINMSYVLYINALNANPTKLSNTLKKFVGNRPQIVWVCLTILWGCA